MLPLSWLQWIGHVVGFVWTWFQKHVVETLISFVSGMLGPTITLDNGMQVKRMHKLAEGGFSVVYFAKGTGGNDSGGTGTGGSGGGPYALKQIQCPDSETRSQCVKEAQVHYNVVKYQQQQQQQQKYLSQATIMPLLGMTFTSSADNGSSSNNNNSNSVCYMCFPFYEHSLRQEVNARTFDPIKNSIRERLQQQQQQQKHRHQQHQSKHASHPMMRMSQQQQQNRDSSSSSSSSLSTEDTIIKDVLRRHGAPWNSQSLHIVLQLFDGLCYVVQTMHEAGYSHRDIKLENVLLQSRRTIHITSPILMDLGSAGPIYCPLHTRQQLLQIVDEASEHTTMSYRPPELWPGELRVASSTTATTTANNNNNDPTKSTATATTTTAIDPQSTLDYTKVDVWMLGCTLFGILWGASPYETEFSTRTGQLKVIETTHNKILSDTIPWPNSNTPTYDWYPNYMREFIQFILQKDRLLRPTLVDVRSKLHQLQMEHFPDTYVSGTTGGAATSSLTGGGGGRFRPMHIEATLSSSSTTKSIGGSQGSNSRSNSLGSTGSLDLESQITGLLQNHHHNNISQMKGGY